MKDRYHIKEKESRADLTPLPRKFPPKV